MHIIPLGVAVNAGDTGQPGVTRPLCDTASSFSTDFQACVAIRIVYMASSESVPLP